MFNINNTINFLNRCKSFSNCSQVRYLTPCEILNEYLRDPCSIFGETIVPIESVPPIHSIPPGLGPMGIPPLPPGLMGSVGHFIADLQLLINGQSYRIDEVNIEGDSIIYDPGTDTVLLNPNTTYRYSYMTKSVLDGAMVRNIENILIKDSDFLPGTEVINDNVQPRVLTVLQGSGQFMTGNNQEDLSLAFLTNSPGQNLSSATFTITEVLP